ncbi:MAG: hypothetical protein ACI8Y8_002668 [Planctomycetota bacterium]|jgi:hypothetical protein
MPDELAESVVVGLLMTGHPPIINQSRPCRCATASAAPSAPSKADENSYIKVPNVGVDSTADTERHLASPAKPIAQAVASIDTGGV